MSIRSTGYVAAIPFALSILGAAGGGWSADRLMTAGFSAVNSRKIPLVTGVTGAALFTICAAEASSNVMAVTCVTLAMVFGSLCAGLFWALASVIAPPNSTASAGSLANFGGYLGGALTPMVTGFIVQATGSFTSALLLGGGIGLLSALCYLLLIRDQPIMAELHGAENAVCHLTTRHKAPNKPGSSAAGDLGADSSRIETGL
jgi:MFS family permease